MQPPNTTSRVFRPIRRFPVAMRERLVADIDPYLYQDLRSIAFAERRSLSETTERLIAWGASKYHELRNAHLPEEP